MIKPNLSTLVNGRQKKIAFVLVMIVVVIMSVIVVLQKKQHPQPKTLEPVKTIDFSSPLDHVDTSALWKTHIQRRINELETNNKVVEKQHSQVKDRQGKLNSQLSTEFSAFQRQMDGIRKELATLKQAKKRQAKSQQSAAKKRSGFLPQAPGQGVQTIADPPLISQKIKIDTLSLKGKAPVVANKNPNNYVPAGSFATAVLLGGADASAGAMSQANPKPILLKIVSRGTLPNDKHSHLKGCMVTAAVIGDISAERGNIRLERLSCTKHSGQIIDMSVKGTLFGHDGKSGVRGHPVWREGPLIARAGVAGLFQGLGRGVEAKFTPQATLLSNGNQFPTNQQLLGRSMGSGLNGAFDKIADYNIKRAEQYHPIIQISAGQFVDVVFLKGLYIDGAAHQDGEYETKESLAAIESNKPTSTNGLLDSLNVKHQGGS